MEQEIVGSNLKNMEKALFSLMQQQAIDRHIEIWVPRKKKIKARAK